eukprot:356543-Chlamydomonas_euryale.AAC.6
MPVHLPLHAGAAEPVCGGGKAELACGAGKVRLACCGGKAGLACGRGKAGLACGAGKVGLACGGGKVGLACGAGKVGLTCGGGKVGLTCGGGKAEQGGRELAAKGYQVAAKEDVDEGAPCMCGARAGGHGRRHAVCCDERAVVGPLVDVACRRLLVDVLQTCVRTRALAGG